MLLPTVPASPAVQPSTDPAATAGLAPVRGATQTLWEAGCSTVLAEGDQLGIVIIRPSASAKPGPIYFNI